MQTKPKICFFLGANSPSGFYSLYDQLIDPAQARDILILKGGPGCGKSSLMKRVAASLEEVTAAIKADYPGIPAYEDFPELLAAIKAAL